jgi:excisionase family DNA binding protein
MIVNSSTATKTNAVDDLTWRVHSVCREHPTQLWFAVSPRDMATAKALCADCAVQSPCLEFALSRPELLGIWAATTPSERAVMRRAGRDSAPAQAAVNVAEAVERAPMGGASLSVEPKARPTQTDGRRPGEAGPPAVAGTGFDRGFDRRIERDVDRFGEDELLTPAEAARRLGVTPNTVTRWSRAGKISAIQTIGGHRRYRCSEIDRVLRCFDLT